MNARLMIIVGLINAPIIALNACGGSDEDNKGGGGSAGSDASTGGALTPRAVWEAFRKLPLTDAEFRTIAANVPPYLR